MRALICGVTGQDGSYLSKLLLEKHYTVCGTHMDTRWPDDCGVVRFGLQDKIQLLRMDLANAQEIRDAIVAASPNEIYILAGQTSVVKSVEVPVETLQINSLGVLHLLETVRTLNKRIKIFHASSSECFGDIGERKGDETVPFNPKSPYAVSKVAAYNLCKIYRETHGMFVANGILYHHESPLRPESFVTQKIVSAAVRIRNGAQERLQLGNLDTVRDWGWAEEYVEAMWRMLQADEADDYVVATGQGATLRQLVEEAFQCCGLDWRQYVDADAVKRPTDTLYSVGNPSKIKHFLGWEAKKTLSDIVRAMVAARG